MPVFGFAALWNGSAHAERVRELVEVLGVLLPSVKPPGIVVTLREAEASLELKVELSTYPRGALEDLTRQLRASGGTLVELWRLPKAERDAFRAQALSGPDTHRLEDYETAALVLHGHLQQLALREPLPEGPPPGPPSVRIAYFETAATAAAAAAPKSAPAPPPPKPQVPPGPEPVPGHQTFDVQRRGRRFAVKLELDFRTELDFVREHATNISNGGLFVRTAHRPPVDSVVTVTVRLPNGERLNGEAVVVHTLDDPYQGGVGLAFLTDDTTFSQTLDDYLASLADAPGG